MNQTKSRSLQAAALLSIAVLAFGTIQYASAEIKLEAELELAINANDGSGKAKYEERDDRIKASVEIEDMEPNTDYVIHLNGQLIAPITTDDFGFGDVNLDSRNNSIESDLANAIQAELENGGFVEILQGDVVVLSGTLQ